MDQVLSLSTIRERRDALEAVLNEARSRIADCEAELRELEIAERFVKRFGTAEHEDAASGNVTDDEYEAKIRKKGLFRFKATGQFVSKTLKGSPSELLLIAVMRDASSVWSSANEVQSWASSLKGANIPMTTISPLLTKLKNDGVIVRNGLKVALAERLKENEAPTDHGGQEEPQTVPAGSTVGGEDADRKEVADAEA